MRQARIGWNVFKHIEFRRLFLIFYRLKVRLWLLLESSGRCGVDRCEFGPWVPYREMRAKCLALIRFLSGSFALQFLGF